MIWLSPVYIVHDDELQDIADIADCSGTKEDMDQPLQAKKRGYSNYHGLGGQSYLDEHAYCQCL